MIEVLCCTSLPAIPRRRASMSARSLETVSLSSFSYSSFPATAVTAASLRRAPTQNGSDRRKYLSFAHAEHASELALRPSDRQVRSAAAAAAAAAAATATIRC